jgi:hypothetical protein
MCQRICNGWLDFNFQRIGYDVAEDRQTRYQHNLYNIFGTNGD